MDKDGQLILKSYLELIEEYREDIRDIQYKSNQWESIARRLYYVAKESGALTDFQKEWYLNEILEAQGTLAKKDNPNRQ